jgi:hypothetical protein
MTHSYRQQGAAWQTPSGYADTHCRQCDLGWTRTGKEGGVLTYCLLDREPVLADMTDCDRFEPRPLKKAPSETQGVVTEEVTA